jgi:Tfp pilus assembly protein PilO
MKSLQQLDTARVAIWLLGILVFVLAAIMVNQIFVRSRLSVRAGAQKQLLSELTAGASGNRLALNKYDEMAIKLCGRIPDGTVRGNMPFMINQVAGVMQAHGLKPETLKPEPVTVVDGIDRVPLRVSFSAGIGNMVLVVRDIENTVPVMHIDQLSIRPATDKSGTLHAEMTISSFVVGGDAASKTASGISSAGKETAALNRDSNVSRGS